MFTSCVPCYVIINNVLSMLHVCCVFCMEVVRDTRDHNSTQLCQGGRKTHDYGCKKDECVNLFVTGVCGIGCFVYTPQSSQSVSELA